MKTLLLLRHAKPSQTSPTNQDFDRPLADAGRAQAPLVARLLRQHNLTPDAIVCSPAARARETLALTLGASPELAAAASSARFDARIYEASTEQLLDVISEVEDGAVETLLVVGHNPGLSELITRLTGESVGMSPATLARLDLDIEDWSSVGAARARLAFAVRNEE